MANIKSIIESVKIESGVVQFRSRYAAREFMDFVLSEEFFYICGKRRILSCRNGRGYVVYLPDFGAFLSESDLELIKRLI